MPVNVGGKPLYELNRILRPGGFFVWSATPVYRNDERDRNVWKCERTEYDSFTQLYSADSLRQCAFIFKRVGIFSAMVSIAKSMCWNVVAKATDSSGIGLVIYQKPASPSCYEQRKESTPPLCEKLDQPQHSWYHGHLSFFLVCIASSLVPSIFNPRLISLGFCDFRYLPLDSCLTRLPGDGSGKQYRWPSAWPKRLSDKPTSFSGESEEMFYEDTQHWSSLVSDVYMEGIGLNWSRVRNVMDMNAGYGG